MRLTLAPQEPTIWGVMAKLFRRDLLAALGGAGLAARRAAAAGPWSALPGILARIRAPRFADRAFPITRYGAKDDGRSDAAEAIRQAIEAASRAGGGRVVVPEGEFRCGAIHLRSNVNLEVRKGATLRFSPDPELYPIVLTRFEGLECMNYSPLIYANGQSNIAVTGEGTLDGGASCEQWWPWSGKANCGPQGGPNQRAARTALGEMAEKGVPPVQRVFGKGGWLRPSFIEPYNCTDVLIEGVTIRNSPMWEVHPTLSRNVTVRNLTVVTHGPNNDGCNPESCTDVLIEGCTFDTGDDCIAIKSGRNADGRRVNRPSENIVIRNCTMKDGHGGVTLGSECSGHIRNVFAENCRMDSPSLDRVLRFKNNAMRGGILEHVYLRNIEVGQVAGAAIEVDFNYEEGPKGAFLPVVRDVEVSGLRVRKCAMALSLRGYANSPIRDVRLRDCTFEQAAKPNLVENVEGLTLDAVRVNGKLL
jgi:polygalacturonase